MDPKFSVLIPTHNRADVLSYAIESVLAQSESSFELLVVGDGCSDNTAEVVASYTDDSRVHWYDFPKAHGFGYANRNKALRDARGRYIAFLGHDDIYFPDHLEILGRHLDENSEINAVYSRPLWVDVGGEVIPSPWNLNDPQMYEYFFTERNEIPALCFLYRAELHEQIGYWDETIEKAGDWDLWKRVIQAKPGKSFAFEPTPTGLHFKANWKTSSKIVPSRLWEILKFLRDSQVIPPELCIDSSAGPSQQHVFWDELKVNPENLTRRIRSGAVQLLDNICQIQFPLALENAARRKREKDAFAARAAKLKKTIEASAGPRAGRSA
ncbi:MAG: glycosyltransferase [Bdellovibrionales bacterium]|nr:glycosyltransferase [Bdellovibrionales bacterium]